MRVAILLLLIILLLAASQRSVEAGFAVSTTKQQPWCEACIDYSAANEFIAAHYGVLHGQQNSYFAQDRAVERIYNARQILDPPASVPDCGFALLALQSLQQPPTVNWRDLHSIQANYLPQLREAILSVYEQDDVVTHVIFWCPTVRTDSTHTMTRLCGDETPRAGYVATAHIDTDVNAYKSVDQLVNVIKKNCFPGAMFNATEIIEAIKEGRRFAIVNAWRNIGSAPVRRAPLAFCPMQYVVPNTAFPYGVRDITASHWYTYPDMTPDELLLFSQYDRDASHQSDLFHCALVDRGTDTSPRESFDVRCLVVFRTIVPVHRDRLARRTPSILNQKQSQTFCGEQAEKRQQRNT